MLLPHMCYHAKLARPRLNLLAQVEGSKNLEDAGTPSLRMGVAPRNMLLPHLSYHANFSRSGSNRTSVIMEIRQKI